MTTMQTFCRARDRLAELLDENNPVVDQETLDDVRDIFHVDMDTVVPATVNVNTSMKRHTDMGPGDPDVGHQIVCIAITDVLSADCLNGLLAGDEARAIAARWVLDVLHRNIVARIAGSEYKPWINSLGSLEFPVHNDLVTLQRTWDEELLKIVIQRLTENGVFTQGYHDERFGVPNVSQTDTNPDMCRLWSTDACMALRTQKKQRPDLVPRNLVTNAGFLYHPKNVLAMLRTVNDPDWYRLGDANNGIAHIFVPTPKNSPEEGLKWDEERGVPVLESIAEDPAWFNRKRLESQAMVLLELLRAIKAGAFLENANPNLAKFGRNWGFHWVDGRSAFAKGNDPMNDAQKEYVIAGIQVAAMYLLAVQWDKESERYDFEAPTVSSWEEAPIPGGCASDTGFIGDAFEELHDVLFNEDYHGNPTIEDVRSRLQLIELSHEDGGDANELLQNSAFADFRLRDNLDRFTEAGELKIGDMVTSKVLEGMDGIARPTPTGVAQYRTREADMSLALLARYKRSFDTNLCRDAMIRLGIIRFIEAHLMDGRFNRRYGMKRYPTFKAKGNDGSMWLVDSYLQLNFNLGLEIPGLVIPMFASLVASEHHKITDHIERRFRMGTASPRDELLHIAWKRFIQHSASEVAPARDATTTDGMQERQQFSLPETTAQWSIGPTAAVGALAVAKLNLLQHIETHKMNDWRQSLLTEINRTLNRFINHCLRTVVKNTDEAGQTVYRSDGTTLPATYSVVEAFQAVLDVDGNVAWLPGDHTLPWSAAQLDDGLHLAKAAARREVNVLGSSVEA